jgi:peptide/nickel transport system substrate-binding protein/oligopeptide transport system substrate-binding protein
MDPAYSTAALDGSLIALVYDALVRYDADGKVVPGLAKSWEGVDNQTFLFKLHEGVKFHNGEPFTAHDVKYSFERVLDPKTASPRVWVFDKIRGAKEFNQGNAESVAGIKVIDNYTLMIELEQPFAPFISMLGMPAAHVVCKKEIEKYADPKDYRLNPVGTGPYKWKLYNPGDRVEFEANLDYFTGRPYLDGIVYRVIKDSQTAVAEFEAGYLDSLGIPSAERERFLAHPKYKDHIVVSTSNFNWFIAFMNNKEPYTDVRVRQALCYAIDKDLIMQTVRKDIAIATYGPIPPGLDGYRPDLRSYPYNPEKAKQLLAAAGFKPGELKFKIAYSDSTSNLQLLEPIQQMLQAVGFDAQLEGMERTAFFAAVRAGEVDCYLLNWGMDYPDAENYLFPLFHTANWGPGGNGPRFSDPEVDALLELAHKTMDYDERIKLYHKIEDLVIEKASRAWLYVSIGFTAYQPYVRGTENYMIFNANKMLTRWLDK